jgi:energy-coupling factor transporter ATP-binding protein EcfA2
VETVQHFRPPSHARDDYRKTVDTDHYWWLAYEWENLYLVCSGCARNQGTQFPTAGDRAPTGTSWDNLVREKPLLIDPCREEPADWLQFFPYGKVVPREQRNLSRGQATIDVFGLNREELVAQRITAADRVLMSMERYFSHSLEQERRVATVPQASRNILTTALDPRLPFLAVRREACRTVFIERGYDPLFIADLLTTAGIDASWLRVKSRPAAGRTTEAAAPAAPPSLRTTFVTRVEISNFRAIRELNLELLPSGMYDPLSTTSAAAVSDARRWTVLLGENGAGKSTVVQAIALALGGKTRSRQRMRRSGDLLRRAPEGQRQPRKGYVKVHLSTDPEPLGFTFSGRRLTWLGQADGAGTYLRAYGSTRLLPRATSRRDVPRGSVRIDNLFDPYQPLYAADRWLASLEPDRFNAVALCIKDLLRLPPEKDLFRDGKGQVMIPDHGDVPRPLRQLSDGYQTVVALAVDVMAGLPEQETDFSTTPGIVILDELGTHLHPRWRMEIVGSLRRAFRSMQFIATTHEPLCLRGLRAGELVVMRRKDDEITAVTELPSPEGLRVDQLLTSPLFGLYTTIDPGLDTEFQEYYELLATPVPTPDQTARREQLRERLAQFSFLGYTRRDQLVLDVVDSFLASQREAPSPVVSLPDDVREQILRIWKGVGRMEGATP